MSNLQADAFVLFGATGDLARRKVFPALQALVQRGQLDAPVIGVALSGWDLKERGRTLFFLSILTAPVSSVVLVDDSVASARRCAPASERTSPSRRVRFAILRFDACATTLL